MSKKILSVLVAIMMVASMLSVCAFAASYSYEDEDTAAEYTQDWALGEPVDNGDGTWSVDVYLTTNYATGPIQFVLTNSDNTVATIEDVILGDAIPADYSATLSVSKSKGKVMIIADTAGVSTITGEEIDGVIATVVYTYAGAGSATIAIKNDAKSEANPAGTLIAARMNDGDLVTGTGITGQTVTVGGSVVIGGGAEAEAPTLGVIDGTIGVIDTTRTTMGDFDATEVTGYIYGVEPEAYETIDMVFEVVGDGEIEIVPNAAGSECGTGTLVNVLDLGGNVVETYCLIIFGDINGDGMVTVDDSIDGEMHDLYMYEAGADGMRICSTEVIFAGDINFDGDITADDTIIIEMHDNYMYEEGSDGMRMYQADVMSLLG